MSCYKPWIERELERNSKGFLCFTAAPRDKKAHYCMKQTGRCTFRCESPEEEQQFGPHRFVSFLFLRLHIPNASLNLHAEQIPHDLISDCRAYLESECGILFTSPLSFFLCHLLLSAFCPPS